MSDADDQHQYLLENSARRDAWRASLLEGPLADLIRWFERQDALCLLDDDGVLTWDLYASEHAEDRRRRHHWPAESATLQWEGFFDCVRWSTDLDGPKELQSDREVSGCRNLFATREWSQKSLGCYPDDVEYKEDVSLKVFPSREAFVEYERELRRECDRENLDQARAENAADSALSQWRYGSWEDFVEAPSLEDLRSAFDKLPTDLTRAYLWFLFSEIARVHEVTLRFLIRDAIGCGHEFVLLAEVDGTKPTTIIACTRGGDLSMRKGDEALVTIANLGRSPVCIDDRAALVRSVTKATGWARRAKRQHGPLSIALRVIADVLTTNLITGILCVPGWSDVTRDEGHLVSPCSMPSWLDEIPEGKALWLLPEAERERHARRYWLLARRTDHRRIDDAWPWWDGPAIVVDIEAAVAIDLRSHARESIVDAYVTAGNSLFAARLVVERMLEARSTAQGIDLGAHDEDVASGH